MKKSMKKILVSGVQSQVDNETFIERIAYLLNDKMLEILCTGVPVSILDYYPDKIKDIIKRNGSNVLEIKNVYLTFDPESPVCVEYGASIVRYFASQEDAEEAAKRGNRYAGSWNSSESNTVSYTIRYTEKINLTIDQANTCCVFSEI